MPRIYNTTTKFQNSTKFAEKLIGTIIKQGCVVNHMKKALLKLLNSHEHEECLIKFSKMSVII